MIKIGKRIPIKIIRINEYTRLLLIFTHFSFCLLFLNKYFINYYIFRDFLKVLSLPSVYVNIPIHIELAIRLEMDNNNV